MPEISFSLIKQKKEDIFGVLDLGSESAKALIIKKEQIPLSKSTDITKTITILGKGIQNYERFGVFDGRDFEMDVMQKAIQLAICQAQTEAGLKIQNLALGLPAHIFKARVSDVCFKRKNPKAIIKSQNTQEVFDSILEKAQNQISEGFLKESGILPQELEFLSTQILEIKIDDYSVPQFAGFKGKFVKVKVLVTFLPKYYLQNIKKLMELAGFSILKILHQAQGQAEIIKRYKDSLFLDIGSDFTQIFLAKNGILQKIEEFEIGGKNFYQNLCVKFGMLPADAQNFAHRYQRFLLEDQTRARLRELFLREAQNWFLNLNREIGSKFFFEEIFCFGGGANYPEILEVLERNFKIKPQLLSLNNFPEIQDKTLQKASLQFITPIFLTYAL